MTNVDELLRRVETLEETVSHLSTHHDEQFLMVHDDTTADTCDRLFNVNLRNVRERQQTKDDRKHRETHRKRRVLATKRKTA